MTPAFAEAAGAAPTPQSQMMSSLLMILIFVAIFYFFIIRPQRKQKKKQQDMMSGLRSGDRVITIGGFYATVVETKDKDIILDLADGVRVRMVKNAISGKVVEEPTKEAK